MFQKLAFLSLALKAIKNQESPYLASRNIASAGTCDRVSCQCLLMLWGDSLWDSRIPGPVPFEKGIPSVIQVYLLNLFIEMYFSLLKYISLYYSDINFGNENWEKIFQSENHLNALQKGGNERDGWMDGWIGFVINSLWNPAETNTCTLLNNRLEGWNISVSSCWFPSFYNALWKCNYLIL